MGENQPGFILPVSRQKVKVENLLQILHNITLVVWFLPGTVWHHDSDRTTWQWHCGCTFYLFLSRYMPCLPTSSQLGLRKWESNSLYAWFLFLMSLVSLSIYIFVFSQRICVNPKILCWFRLSPSLYNQSWIILTILN